MKNKQVREIMTSPVVKITTEEKLTEAIALLLRWHISGLPELDERGRLVGIVTEHDIMNFALSGDAADTRVSQAMTKDVVSVSPQTDVSDVIALFGARRIRRVPVVENGQVVGIVSGGAPH